MQTNNGIADFNIDYFPKGYCASEMGKIIRWTFKYNSIFTKKQIMEKIFLAFAEWIEPISTEDITQELNAHGLRLIVTVTHKGDTIHMYLKNNSLVWFSQTKPLFELEIDSNVFSDYPRNKKTGELVDFTSFAYRNRERLDASMRTLEKLVEGEIIDWDPKVGDYGPNGHKWKQHNINRHDWSAEEIYKYGYLPLTERKEEYERQEASKKG